jgi:hypothetical protein
MNSNVFFVILANNYKSGQISWMKLDGAPPDTAPCEFLHNRFNVDWTQQIPSASTFSAETSVKLAWAYCERFFEQVNGHAAVEASRIVLIRNHGFIPTRIKLMKYTIADDGENIIGEVVDSIDITV